MTVHEIWCPLTEEEVDRIVPVFYYLLSYIGPGKPKMAFAMMEAAGRGIWGIFWELSGRSLSEEAICPFNQQRFL